ncbi:low molecular weight heat shock protein ersh 15 [Neocallimastix californiae]|uniref:Low molecular weight heat shock protein ersh 15 n=1 Tax=Neocallimastix californiae TaxID=1754190 RepID=A0A1Y2ALE6_9FUNG|nr:low molecular weight heat shock protein ersh 15 [Neocallimastix californiae]|eukprot:ORY23398.1 low molecular weight heat shock protein ersh 15 [Neocallimastix californiae]
MNRQYGKFSRSFSLPENANVEKIEAKMANGVLEIIIPKAEPPKNQRRTIQIQ